MAPPAKSAKKSPSKKSPSPKNPGVKEELCTLVLQGGGALGAYQAGVYEAMDAHGLRPDWVAGVSIGAINAAIIAGNPPERRVARLREFWDGVSSQLKFVDLPKSFGTEAREILNESRAAMVAALGVPGFFIPRMPPAPFQQPGTRAALSYYDTAPLQHTLERLIDFDLINTTDPRHKVRLSVGTVNVTTGNFRYFDSTDPDRHGPIGPRHIMASGALPPGFPPIEIDGEFYWDGGLVSNTPLQYVIDQPRAHDMLVLQVDLFSARGRLPRNLSEVAEREKDIRFASRTRLNTDLVAEQQKIGAAARRLAAKLPPNMAGDPDLAELLATGSPDAVTILHLIHRSKHYETQSKDYEFSRQTMLEHWAAGQADVECSLASPRWAARSRAPAGITVLDLTPPTKIHNHHKEAR
ncbi:patatin-like phospholipase family protein [Polaromonas sp. C04]|uniref:patatin-like phospholipase family protein n=1 Tax=Polaromonas sp. C04 TaxID=1945857 RepID=UPI000984BDF1|nr:patatin-like phospholipase family protein [Polaromonas sp. C04]